MYATRTKANPRARERTTRPMGWGKMLEVACWGALMWGIVRVVFRFFHFTPYGINVFSRPLLGMSGEQSGWATAVGFAVLLASSIIAVALYALLFARFRIRWAGLLYGAAYFLLFGMLFQMEKWNMNTLSSELTWFATYGLFIGMSLMTERFDET